MPNLIERILGLVQTEPGLSDREITDRLFLSGSPLHAVNSRCRLLERKGFILRSQRHDGRIGNYPPHVAPPVLLPTPIVPDDTLTEDALKRALDAYLRTNGWMPTIAWS